MVWARRSSVALVVTVAVLWGNAFAYDGFTVGLFGGVSFSGTSLVNLRGIYPLVENIAPDGEPVQFSARADVTQALSGNTLPALSVTALLSGQDPGLPQDIETYVGAGLGLGFVLADLGRPFLSFHVLAGARLPLSERLTGVAELSVSGSSTEVSAPGLSLGVEYRVGGLK